MWRGVHEHRRGFDRSVSGCVCPCVTTMLYSPAMHSRARCWWIRPSIPVMWIRIRIHLGPWIQRYKMNVKKAELNQPFFFTGNYFFQGYHSRYSSDESKSLRFRFRLDFFFFTFKYVFKSIWWFYWPGSVSEFIKFCGAGYNQFGSTSLGPIVIQYFCKSQRHEFVKTLILVWRRNVKWPDKSTTNYAMLDFGSDIENL